MKRPKYYDEMRAIEAGFDEWRQYHIRNYSKLSHIIVSRAKRLFNIMLNKLSPSLAYRWNRWSSKYKHAASINKCRKIIEQEKNRNPWLFMN